MEHRANVTKLILFLELGAVLQCVDVLEKTIPTDPLHGEQGDAEIAKTWFGVRVL